MGRDLFGHMQSLGKVSDTSGRGAFFEDLATILHSEVIVVSSDQLKELIREDMNPINRFQVQKKTSEEPAGDTFDI